MNTERQDAALPRHATPGDRRGPPDQREPRPVHAHRQRDIGIGYGSSSGYGAALHFLDGHVDPMFRLRW